MPICNYFHVIGCLHDPANVQQISSKRPTNVQQTSSISTCILNTFAGSLLDRVNTPLDKPAVDK